MENEFMASVNFVNKNHAVGLNQHHFEWCPKYRRKCFKNPKKAEEMESLLRCIAKDKNIIVHDIVVDIDHIHMFVSLPFDISVSKAFNLLKGISSYEFFRLHPNFRKMYRRGHFWSPGHFSRSVSNVTSKAIHSYIQSHDFAGLNESVRSVELEYQQLGLADFM